MAENRPNFYVLLDLNPHNVWDQDLFDRVLKEKQKEWNQQRMGMGKNVLVARRNIELIPEIRRVMYDPSLRAREAQAVQASERDLAEQREARLIEFEQRLHSLQEKRYMQNDEFTALISDFKDVLTEDEIVRQIDVLVLSPDDIQPTLEELPLAVSILVDIDEKLALLYMSSLYELLRLHSTASQAELYRAAEHVYEDYMRRQPKTVAVNAGTSLAGHAKHIFSSEKKRQRYDEHLKQHATINKSAPGPVARPEEGQAQVMFRPRVGDISDVRVRNIGTALRLTWRWPDNCYQALVVFSNERWPQPQANIGTSLLVTKAQYEAGGYYDLYAQPNYHYYIVVMAIMRDEDRSVTTAGARAEGYLMPQMTVRYEIKNPGFGRRQRTLHLYTPAPCRMPTLVLRYKRNGQPLSKSEGEQLHREVGPIDIPLEKIIQLPETPFPPDTYVKLFLEEDVYYAFVTIYHPQERKLRLG